LYNKTNTIYGIYLYTFLHAYVYSLEYHEFYYKNCVVSFLSEQKIRKEKVNWHFIGQNWKWLDGCMMWNLGINYTLIYGSGH